jgi:hypothetical protein
VSRPPPAREWPELGPDVAGRRAVSSRTKRPRSRDRYRRGPARERHRRPRWPPVTRARPTFPGARRRATPWRSFASTGRRFASASRCTPDPCPRSCATRSKPSRPAVTSSRASWSSNAGAVATRCASLLRARAGGSARRAWGAAWARRRHCSSTIDCQPSRGASGCCPSRVGWPFAWATTPKLLALVCQRFAKRVMQALRHQTKREHRLHRVQGLPRAARGARRDVAARTRGAAHGARRHPG